MEFFNFSQDTLSINHIVPFHKLRSVLSHSVVKGVRLATVPSPSHQTSHRRQIHHGDVPLVSTKLDRTKDVRSRSDNHASSDKGDLVQPAFVGEAKETKDSAHTFHDDIFDWRLREMGVAIDELVVLCGFSIPQKRSMTNAQYKDGGPKRRT
jgi:hypothetical protein